MAKYPFLVKKTLFQACFHNGKILKNSYFGGAGPFVILH